MTERDLATTPEAAAAPSIEMLGSRGAREFIRYGVASLLALALDTGLLLLLTEVYGVSYLISGAVGFVAGMVAIYILSIRWVFDERALDPLKEFMLFAAIGLVGLGINELILFVFTGLVSVHYLLSKILSVALVFSWNFAARKYLLFR
ncbi:MAG: GtrA family protein [Minisyncoccia bacterium]